MKPTDQKTGAMEHQTELVVEVAAMSDAGCRRPNNEDSFGYDLASNIFVVCDGMGGMAAGEVASRIAVDKLMLLYGELGSLDVPAEERLHRAIEITNESVWSLSREREVLHGMGTTLVTACVDGRRLIVGNVGDSRAYFLRDGGCVQITHDHSYVEEQVRQGLAEQLSGDTSPLRALITRAIGAAETVMPDLFVADLQSGDVVLLTTDGLTRYAQAEEIANCISAGRDLAETCKQMIESAKALGGEDNVTCLLLRFA
ncbi:MAG: family protein phosphatase [Acidobacteriaceae bacterium]|nr:family protein phosphatase [Acidobacteriaceae bacterium]